MMLKVNPNIQNLKPSATLAINQKVLQLRKDGKKVFHFGFGQSPFTIHSSIVNALCENATNNHYLPSTGLVELQKTVTSFLKRYFNLEVDSANVFIGPGSKELLYQSILLFEGTFLIPKGSWVSYVPQVKSKGGTYRILDTYFKDNYKLTPSVLETYCLENSNDQKILILNSPNNPTGAVYSEAELKALATICRKHKIIVLADEIYALLKFNGNALAMAAYYPEGTITFGGLSKIFSAGGYRMGYMALPKELSSLYKAYRSLFSETFSAVTSPVQFAAVEAFKMPKTLETSIEQQTAILNTIANYVFDCLTEVGVKCTQPQGGFYLMVDFENFRNKFEKLELHSSTEIANYLIDKEQIALLPGEDFYFEESDLIFRLAFVDFDGELAQNHTADFLEKPTEAIENYCPNVFEGIKKLIRILTK